jgi:hypothetical protein
MHTQTHNFTILDFVYRKISYNGPILQYTKSSIVKWSLSRSGRFIPGEEAAAARTETSWLSLLQNKVRAALRFVDLRVP